MVIVLGKGKRESEVYFSDVIIDLTQAGERKGNSKLFTMNIKQNKYKYKLKIKTHLSIMSFACVSQIWFEQISTIVSLMLSNFNSL